MCGIAGLIQLSDVHDEDIDLIKEMNQIQRHRGPDDEGLYFDQKCVLGHRRLSIIDLSSAFGLRSKYLIKFSDARFFCSVFKSNNPIAFRALGSLGFKSIDFWY